MSDSDKSVPLLSSDSEYKDSYTALDVDLPATPLPIDSKAPLSLSAPSEPEERKELSSPPLLSPSSSASSVSQPGSVMTLKDQKARFGLSYQFQIFLRSVLILVSLTVGAWALLRYVPSQPYLAWLPMFAFAGVAYLSFFPRNKLRLRSYLRLCSLLLVVSLHQSMCSLLVVWLIRALSDDAIGWRYALLTPYFFGLMVFGRLSPVIHRHDPRSILIHILYDPPALLTCFVYSVIFKSPLNRLYTPHHGSAGAGLAAVQAGRGGAEEGGCVSRGEHVRRVLRARVGVQPLSASSSAGCPLRTCRRPQWTTFGREWRSYRSTSSRTTAAV